ncbi:MAG: alpha-amylase family glycosyl hydrolase [Patescibacteria group bacterium]|nr:alpha-amylase family glycosyl hydrolase [Patescibacteria group bacterium]
MLKKIYPVKYVSLAPLDSSTALFNGVKKLYPKQAEEVYKKLRNIIEDFKKRNPSKARGSHPLFSEKDAILICYADHVRERGVRTFKTMHKFLRQYIGGIINKVHFLPFYPWSSDDGFSVKDYYKVSKQYGGRGDLKPIAKDFGLMFDCVANHMSVQSEWFQKFLAGDKKYKDYFIVFSKEEHENNKKNFAKVFRPRKQPLLTLFKTRKGEKYVWTTFSEDQADLNFSNPEVFLEMVKILLFYVENGAKAIRLDAIAYVWKKMGTACFNLSKTHTLVQIVRAVFNEAAPHVWVITETVLPHKENTSYFGNGSNEAHLVYHFQLETLLLHTMLSGNSSLASNWLRKIKYAGEQTSYLNLSVSHDGIHAIPARGILNKKQMRAIALDCEKKGGKILERDSGNGETEIYEMNITYPSAMGEINKYLASQSIQLALRGVPLIYFNNLIGANNWNKGIEKLGYGRAINREKFDYSKLTKELNDVNSHKHKIFYGYKKLLKARIKEPLFSPLAEQKILNLGHGAMAILRFNKNSDNLLAITNVTNRILKINANAVKQEMQKKRVKDILTQEKLKLEKYLVLKPYEVKWLK